MITKEQFVWLVVLGDCTFFICLLTIIFVFSRISEAFSSDKKGQEKFKNTLSQNPKQDYER
jgi:hypothetical protein